MLALLDRENARLLDRQRQMYGAEAPLWKRYEQACDFLEDDLASGYVRVLQEMISAGWADEVVAHRVLSLMQAWFDVLEDVTREAEARFGSLGPFSAADVAGLIGLAFLGGEAVILLGDDRWTGMVTSALRSPGNMIKSLERDLRRV